ncbi:MAG: hypothetical protein IKH57_26940 [Clostridia bacterium]|nr:hypothetical protein [Clostridia bacterium]
MKRRMLCFALAAAVFFSLLPKARAITSLDSYISANFGRSYDVFSGPGRQYYRANMGKAMYGGGAARVYGYEGDWIMMGYQLSSGDYRIGYIHKNALSTAVYVNGEIQPLHFSHYTAYAGTNCTVTDDPVINMKMVVSLPENTPMTVLATMNTNWYYVEVNTSQGLMRGFVWSGYVKNSSVPVTAAPTAIPLPTAAPLPTWPPVTAAPLPTYRPVITSIPIVTAVPWHPPTARPAPTSVPSPSVTVWLPTAKNMYITGNWPVYSGPGEYYYRANSGKATKGEGSCQVYGIENMGYGDWVMIGYALTKGGYRIGYIRAEALGANAANLPRLSLASRTRRLAMASTLTDDPEHTAASVAEIPAGTYVLYLGNMYSANAVWAYVEVLANNQIMRGFVLEGALEAQ